MRQTLIHGARLSAESQSVALQNFASTAQTFTVLAPSEKSYQGQRGARMLSDYCWTMKGDVSDAKQRRK